MVMSSMMIPPLMAAVDSPSLYAANLWIRLSDVISLLFALVKIEFNTDVKAEIKFLIIGIVLCSLPL